MALTKKRRGTRVVEPETRKATQNSSIATEGMSIQYASQNRNKNSDEISLKKKTSEKHIKCLQNVNKYKDSR